MENRQFSTSDSLPNTPAVHIDACQSQIHSSEIARD